MLSRDVSEKQLPPPSRFRRRYTQADILRVFVPAKKTIFANMHDSAFPRYRMTNSFTEFIKQYQLLNSPDRA